MQQLGNDLRLARERMGLSLADIHQRTKIRTRYLQAIEEGDLAALPGLVYARGFIKSYAEQVGVDGQSLLEEHGMVAPALQQAEIRKAPAYPKPSLLTARTKSYLLQSAVVLVVLGIVTVGYEYLMNRLHRPAAPISQLGSNLTSKTSGTDPHTPSVQSSVYGQDKTGSQTAPAPAPKPETAQEQPSAPLQPVDKVNGVSHYILPAAVPLAVDVSATSGDCWMEVTADGNYVGQETLKMGDHKQFTATRHLTIKTGAAPHVEMKVGKQPVVLESVFGGYTFDFKHQE